LKTPRQKKKKKKKKKKDCDWMSASDKQSRKRERMSSSIDHDRKKEKRLAKRQRRLERAKIREERRIRRKARLQQDKASQDGEEKAAMMHIHCDDRMGKKVQVECAADASVAQLKDILAERLGVAADRIRLQKATRTLKNAIRLSDYEVHDGSSLELYYM
jgi:ubiquitin-like protein 5